MNRERDVLELIRREILSNIPLEARITRIDFEGPQIVVYTGNPAAVYEEEDVIRKIAKTIKKRIVIRADPSVRMDKKKAEEIIRKLIPEEAEIHRIIFDDVTGEVIIKAKRLGQVIGKGGANLKRILIETKWRPKVIRVPPMESKIVERILDTLYRESERRQRLLHEIGRRIHRPTLYSDNYVRIISLGGFKEVGRSAILLQTKESNVLLDCGIKPSSGYRDEFPYFDLPEFDIDSLDAVVITHAHLDHCGALPYLFKYGYRGPVYMTEPTQQLMALLLKDYLEVLQKEGKHPPYTMKDVREAILHTIVLGYGEVTDIAPDIRLTFHYAGHILGSAMAHLHIGNGFCNVVYTGDFKYERTRLLEAATTVFPRLEVLIIESTYGGRDDVMPRRDESELLLIELVRKALLRGGKVLIPVLSVGRGQEIMLVLDEGIKKGLIPKVPVYIDGMVSEATAIHTAYPEFLSRSLRDMMYNDENPFLEEYFHVVKDAQQRLEIVEGEPCIILATSGMLTGGPSVEYLKNLAEDPKNMLIFVSYQIEGTLGRRIMDIVRSGEKEVIVPLSSGSRLEYLTIKMEVHAIEGFSGHSDRKQLINFVRNLRPRPERIIVNHGERNKAEDLANTLSRIFRIPAIAPENMEAIRLR
ncbi:MAG: beta-CASP ribonuclease aCPSF1 [Thermoprotei archaeon]|nr:MAG: beta-CASP ribonuclease aCPSF1 [Thermoprotei archaeon]RLF19834.1 MAG: beta-CASP ribonuclease aCPSF1 [Thermoprotei archaeon]